MFTGIVEEIGTIKDVISGQNFGTISIQAEKVLKGTKIGDSIAVNGVCLTVTTIKNYGFTADVMPETLRRSNLGELKSGDKVNLERAMSADGRFGGHIVSGHIDGIGKIIEQYQEKNAVLIRISASPEILNLIVEKGSISIDGISLTVISVNGKDFQISVIPHTKSQTTLLNKRVGDKVNLENDIIGKYIKKLLFIKEENKPKESCITMEFLSEHGF